MVELLAHELTVHPVSIYRLIEHGLAREGWRWPAVERELVEDWLTSVVLRVLGHRWPAQIEDQQPAAPYAVAGGIVSLTEGTGASTLVEQVGAAVAHELPQAPPGSTESTCATLLGQPLATWLSGSLFRRHLHQFAKRPILWQLSSRRPARRRPPAFSCLLSAWQLDGDTLAKVRGEYLRPLRRRAAQELRSLQPAATRSRQRAGRTARERAAERVAELDDFDTRLARTIDRGFGYAELDAALRAEPLDAWCAAGPAIRVPRTRELWRAAEARYRPSPSDGVRVNLAPLQREGLLALDVLAPREVDRALADRAAWRAAERQWCREARLERPSWW